MTAGLEREIVDLQACERNVAHMRKLGLELPRIADLADPPARLKERPARSQMLIPMLPISATCFASIGTTVRTVDRSSMCRSISCCLKRSLA